MTKLITLCRVDDPEDECSVVANNFEEALYKVREETDDLEGEPRPSPHDADTFVPAHVAGDSAWGPIYNSAKTHEERVEIFKRALAEWREAHAFTSKYSDADVRVVFPEADPEWRFKEEREVPDYDEWFDKFKPIKIDDSESRSFDGCFLETYGEDKKTLAKYPDNRVWTLLDCEGKQYVVAGWRYVDRVGYFVTEVPFTSEDEQGEGWLVD